MLIWVQLMQCMHVDLQDSERTKVALRNQLQ